jgi:phage terminase Nu1 subunit (DNA packaging protein)
MAEAQRNRELIKLQLDVLKLKEAEGELVRADDVKRDMGKLAAMVKSGLMNIPDRIAAELAGMNDPHEIHTLITSEIISTMGELLTAAEQ